MSENTEGRIEVERTIFGKTEQQEKIIVREYQTNTANMGINLKRTINLASYGFNYESMTVGVSINVPCYVEEMSKVYTDISNLGMQLLKREITRAENYVKALAAAQL